MKKIYLLASLFVVFGALAQTETEEIAEAEMKSAASLMSVAVNPNTLNYDVTYHKLEFTVNPSAYFITGKVTTTYTALQNMSTLTFDLVNDLTVSSVKMNNVSLGFTQNASDELVITLPATQNTGVSATVEINYSGAPTASGFGSFVTTTHGSGTPVLWTLSEPFGAREWWPCKQDLNDKVGSIDVYITAPNQYTAVANGLQMSAVTNGGFKTTHFHHGYPIPAYLIAIAVTNYQIYTQQAGLGTPESPFFPIINYMYPETASANQASNAVTPPIMDFFEATFGDYPYRDEKYGHAQFGWGGGMEHTTVSFMTANFSGGYSRSLIAHEMAHQWFGDKVTCGSWNDIWLNEGFAEYLSGLVVQFFDGEGDFIFWKSNKIDNITADSGGAVYLTDGEALNVSRIFSGRLTYDKGAMVVNMLRFKLGDEAFFQGLKNYLEDPALAYGYVTTPQLQAHLETASGMDLDEFFNDWVYNQGYPVYDITAQNIAPGQVKFVISQAQSHPSVDYFEMPVPVTVYGQNGEEETFILDNTGNGQSFIRNISFEVISLEFDREKNIISQFNQTSLGNGNFELTSAIRIYPNPAANTLNLLLPGEVTLQRATIHNLLGQTVLEGTAETSWDISGLASGVHFITLVTDAGTKQLKFIKE